MPETRLEGLTQQLAEQEARSEPNADRVRHIKAEIAKETGTKVETTTAEPVAERAVKAKPTKRVKE